MNNNELADKQGLAGLYLKIAEMNERIKKSTDLKTLVI